MPKYLDSLDYTNFRRTQVQPKYAFNASALWEAEKWRNELRPIIVDLIGGILEEKPDLEAEVDETKEFPNYTRETVYFTSREMLTVKGYLLLPKDWEKPGPCMICLPGHGRGIDDIVGIQEDGAMRQEYGGYQNDFALQCLDHGLAAFAIEQLCFGARRDPKARESGAGASSCQPAAGAALLLGETMAGWRSWDTMRAVDYLETRKEIDPNRIGAMGISGGGMTSLWTAAVDPRLKATLVSGYYCPVGSCVASIPHCIDNYVPGILQVCDHTDLAGLIAPRALFVEGGTEDNIFLVDGVKEGIAKAEKIYEAFHHSERFGHEIFEGEHEFSGKKGFPFLVEQLSA